MNVRAEIAEAISGPPTVSVIVSPDQCVDDGVKVGHFDVEDKDDGCELAVSVEMLQRDETDDVCESGEENTTDKVGCEGGSGDGFSFPRHNDPGTVTAEQVV